MNEDFVLEKDAQGEDDLMVIGDKKINILELYEIEIPLSGIVVRIYTNVGNHEFEFATEEETNEFAVKCLEFVKSYLINNKFGFRMRKAFSISNNIVAPDGIRKEYLDKSLAHQKEFLSSPFGKAMLKDVMEM